MTGRGDVLYLLRPGGPPAPRGEGDTPLVLAGRPGEVDAPDPAAVVDAIFAHERVVVW